MTATARKGDANAVGKPPFNYSFTAEEGEEKEERHVV